MQIIESIRDAWRSNDPSNVVRLLSPRVVWIDNGEVSVGRSEAWAALRAGWDHALHLQTTFDFTEQHSNRLVADIEAEWQDARCGRWFRQVGCVDFSLGPHQLITKVQLDTQRSAISMDDRRLSLSKSSSDT